MALKPQNSEAGSIIVWKSDSTCQALTNEEDGLNLYSNYNCSGLTKPDTNTTKTLLMPIKSKDTSIKTVLIVWENLNLKSMM